MCFKRGLLNNSESHLEMNITLAGLQNLTDEVENRINDGLRDLHLVSFDVIGERIKDCMKIYEETGNANPLRALRLELTKLCREKPATRTKKADKENESVSEINSSKDAPPSRQSAENDTSSGRPRRKAFQEATDKVQNTTYTVKPKLRQNPVKVKAERVSDEDAPLKNIKTEREDMPPPAELPRRGRPKKVKTEKSPRATRTRTTSRKQELENADESAISGRSKTSDVVILQEDIDIISLDGDDAKKEVAKDHTRHTSTESSKRGRSTSTEKKKLGRPRKTKRKKSPVCKETEKSLYEDALNSEACALDVPDHQDVFSTPPGEKMSIGDKLVVVQQPTVHVNRLTQKVLDGYVSEDISAAASSSKMAVNPNQTFVVDKPKMLNANVKTAVDEIMTDDESTENIEIPPKGINVEQVGKILFNPFMNSPVKKKVEAFEKLGAQTATTTRTTRTKTRQKAKAAEDEQKLQAELKEVEAKMDDHPVEGKKSNFTTPIATNRYLPSLTTSANKTNHLGLSDSAVKTLSNLKFSHQQLREREQRRKEKEAEALKKKEAYLQKQSEEKRRKREEKEQKAKLQRELLDKEEKHRIVENQKLKDEKQKQLMLEKQERIQKQREETDKRRMLAKLKADELKREEERKKAEELRLQRKREEDEKRKVEEEKRAFELKMKQNERDVEKMTAQMMKSHHPQVAKQNLPIYMIQKPPLLPTPDCYDSDDENASQRPEVLPWNTRENIHESLRTMSYIDANVKNSWFCVKPQTPNLLELLPNVDPRMLRRNSSAIWKKPPRFTMMPGMDEGF